MSIKPKFRMTMNSMKQFNQFLFLIFCVFSLSSYVSYNFVDGSNISRQNEVICVDHEREALLKFKQGIQIDRCDLLSSWGDHNINCCQWHGIRCDNYTGHVIKLNLNGNNPVFDGKENVCLKGKVGSSLIDLKHLTYLDLSFNGFTNQSIPSFIGSMVNLTYLDLSNAGFIGEIPHQLGNLSRLTFLDVSGNDLGGPIPDTIGNLCNLQELDLSQNNLTDELAMIIQSLSGCASKSLLSLDIGRNQIWGSVPDKISIFSSLTDLSLYDNELNGTISQNLRQLLMLENLDLSANDIEGTLSQNHLLNLSMLNSLDLSKNPKLTVKIDANWEPPFQLDNIELGSCSLGPKFPMWLVRQRNYSSLDISSAGISDRVPQSFTSTLSSKIFYLNISHNKIYGTLPDFPNTLLPNSYDFGLDLSFNNIEGAIPSFPQYLKGSLKLNNNRFSNPIPFLCPQSKMIISDLDLSNNLFSGELPDCWMKFDQLSILHLQNNNFSGVIPASLSYLKRLQVLHLGNNRFLGEIPRSFENLTSLVILDVSHNSFSGFPTQKIGNFLKNLSFLSLENNNFVGEIPLSLCQMSSLQILDLSFNHFNGSIPRCISDITAMQTQKDMMPIPRYGVEVGQDTIWHLYTEDVTIMWKREKWSFSESFRKKFLGLVKAIDLSNNELEGEIPIGMYNLTGLISLNLSRNNLIGSINPEIGQLTALQLLDLSNNHFSAEIPASLANLNYLGVLDLSYNNFSGEIPTGTQLQGFDASAYTGNPDLCGLPLPKCPSDLPSNNETVPVHGNGNGSDIYPGLYISAILGFIVGFWGVCASLILKRSWRSASLGSIKT